MKKRMLYLFIIVIALSVSIQSLWAQNFTLSGVVRDNMTKKPLFGANVTIEGTNRGAATDENGRFSISSLQQGELQIRVSYLGYFTRARTININGNLTENFDLKPRAIESPEVVVTATRARERETPVAFTNVTRDEIQSKYDLQDIPMLLSDVPGVYSYSETGANIGYTYMKIRGFDQSRIAVMLNGIPLNDPESHQVYWVDLADFGENVESIQVQRGVGNSLYGAAAIGGSVNVITSNFSDKRNFSVKIGTGSYNTRKASFGFSSGLIDRKYALYGRFSRLLSDGYRDHAWVDLWSYFFSAVRFDDSMTNKINIYGGPELTHLTYDGITRDKLNSNRRYNPLNDPDDVDNTFQPHYELLTEISFSDNVHLNNSLFYTEAKGYFRNIKKRRELYEYDLESFKTLDPAPYLEFADFKDRDENGFYELKKTDLVRRRWVDNYQLGIIPRFEFTHKNGALTAGAELLKHRGRHWGEILWIPVPVPGIKPNHRYYDYVVDKNSYSVFVHEKFSPAPGLTIMADLQFAYRNYKFHKDTRKNYSFDVSYSFLTPRLGANYNINESLNVFGNFSIAKREPVFRAIYDAQYVYSEPLFNDLNTFKDPLIKEETIYDYEAGLGYKKPNFSAKINLYYMDFRNEHIRYGGQLIDGIAAAGNAKKSYHSGIEISSSYRIIPELTFRLNLSRSRDRLRQHSEFINNWDKWPPGEEVNYDGNRIGGFPETIMNATTLFQKGRFNGRIHVQYIGDQYLDNSENERKNRTIRIGGGYVDKIIDPYTLVNVRFNYNLGSVWDVSNIGIGFSVYNLFNEVYEATGYIDEVPLWIPGPNRNFYLGFSFEM